MPDPALRACLMLPAALFLTTPTATDGEARKTPKATILCLPPGGSPTPCATAAAGSTLRLDANPESAGRAEIHFVEVGGGGNRASVPAKPVAGRDGSYLVTVPRHLCTKDKMGNFEIQRLMSAYNQSETRVQSLGTLTVTC